MNSCVASELTSASTDSPPAYPAATRRDSVDDLAGYSQRLTTGGDNPQPRRLAQQRLDEFGAGRNQMFARIQDQQQLAIANRIDQDVASRSLLTLSDAQRRRYRLRYQIGKHERRQVDQPDAVGKFAHQVRASRTASRVLPTPPAPVSDTNREDASNRGKSSELFRRPTKLVSSAGRLWRAARAVLRLDNGDDAF